MRQVDLTRRQKEIYDYIVRDIKTKGFPPTIAEIRKEFYFKSPTAVSDHLSAIARKGYIKRHSYTSRGIKLVKSSGNGKDIVQIPVVGTIAAGEPIQTLEEIQETISIPKDELGNTGIHYALRVQGNSMIDEGIFDGDVVIIRKQETADNGQSVVAIIDGDSATLKKLYHEKNKIRLQPANPLFLPFYPKEIEIRGIVVKIIRNSEQITEKDDTPQSKFKRHIDYSWDYSGEKTKSFTHGLHTYPAMFIPQVARRLLQKYSKKGDTICDIFCGSGTALVESKVLSRNAYGIDLNPLAIFLAKVKTIALNPSLLNNRYFQLLNRIEKIKDESIKKPDFFNVDFWFKKDVAIKLAKIKKAINEIEQESQKNFFLVAFSETVRLSSNTKNGEFKLVKIHEEKLKDYSPDVLGIFKKKVESNILKMEEFYKNYDKNTWIKIIYGDSSKENGIKENSIDCIITSPPYGDSRTTVAYGQFSRLSAQWLDLLEDPDTASGVDNELLGGKTVKELKHNLNSNYLNMILKEISNKDEKRAKEVLSFFIGLEKCLRQAFKILKPNKYFCVVIGNRLVKQVRIPTDFIIAELCENIGFTCEDIFVRNIPGKRMPSKNSPSNVTGHTEETMLKESIVILRKLKREDN
ncbi:MAG: hypothetical protein COY53_07615 [Elusimicrobia bacterium CG_4_10_14_0_8_um_filter_37_32]|nr:MAG: hypothetical protein COY53_07615 [Elusimicrobia bacterium CG_4_10_14_0_8_um_filter_37_32]